jgi:hypothetical protein
MVGQAGNVKSHQVKRRRAFVKERKPQHFLNARYLRVTIFICLENVICNAVPTLQFMSIRINVNCYLSNTKIETKIACLFVKTHEFGFAKLLQSQLLQLLYSFY